MKSILERRRHPIDYTSGQSEVLLKVEGIMGRIHELYKVGRIEMDVDGRPLRHEDYHNEVFVIRGYSGTGKSTITENIKNAGLALGYKVIIVAPTNKAVNVLKQKLSTVDVETVHKLLYGSPDDDSGDNWTLKTSFHGCVLIIDECSMLDKDRYQDLLTSASFNNVLIFTGDTFQLEPVGTDSGVFKLPNSYTLTEVKRQANQSPILKLATVIRSINSPVCYINHEDEQILVYAFLNGLINEYVRFYEQGQDCIFVTDTNKQRVSINNKIRALLGVDRAAINRNEQLISISNGDFYSNGETFKAGDIKDIKRVQFAYLDYYKARHSITVVCFLNKTADSIWSPVMMIEDYEKPSLYHSQVMSMVYQHHKERRENHEEYKAHPLEEALPSAFFTKEDGKRGISKKLIVCTFGYAISCHKSQGSQWENVFIFQSWKDAKWNNARWFYTALTRSSHKAFVTRESQALLFKANDIINMKYDEIVSAQEEQNKEIDF